MSDELLIKQADDAERDDIMARVEAFRHLATALSSPEGDGEADPNAIARTMAALCIAAGAIFAHLIAAGLAREQDKKRATDNMAKNFRNGIDIGRNAANRLLGTGETRQ